MIIDDNVRKCVVFLAYKDREQRFYLAGTAFYLGRSVINDVSACYLVTAKHVLDQIVTKYAVDEIYVRLNLKDGSARWMPIKIRDWKFHPKEPNVDVAIILMPVLEEFDHLMLPLSMFVSPSLISDYEIGVGDEVFVTGLFRHHHGKKRNIPIVRVGNLAAMDELPVSVQSGEMSAYLIEARSIGGLSGSPVFLNLGDVRRIKGQVRHAKERMIFFLGIIHGHYDVPESAVDGVTLEVEHINTGIAIVTPYYKVLEVLNHPDLIKNEKMIKDYHAGRRPAGKDKKRQVV